MFFDHSGNAGCRQAAFLSGCHPENGAGLLDVPTLSLSGWQLAIVFPCNVLRHIMHEPLAKHHWNILEPSSTI